MIRGSNDVDATNPSFSSPLPTTQTENASHGQQTQPLQPGVVQAQQSPQQHLSCVVSSGGSVDTSLKAAIGQQQVVKPVALNTTALSAVVSNIVTVVSTTATCPGPTNVAAPGAVGPVLQQLRTAAPTSLQQYVLTGGHQTHAISTQNSVSAAHLNANAMVTVVNPPSSSSPQQQMGPIGATSSLARMLATTRAHMHVGYGNPASFGTGPTANKTLQAVSRSTMSHGPQPICSEPVFREPSLGPVSSALMPVPDSVAVTTPPQYPTASPVANSPSCVIPHHVASFTSRDRSPVDTWGQPHSTNLQSPLVCSIPNPSVDVPKQDPSPSTLAACRTVPSTTSLHPLMAEGVHRPRPPPLSVSSVAMSSGLAPPLGPLQVPSQTNRHKRVKLEPKLTASADGEELRIAILDCWTREIKAVREAHVERQTELFFLETGHNFVDYLGWKKRTNPQLIIHLKGNPIDSDEDSLPVMHPIVSSSTLMATTATTTTITTTTTTTVLNTAASVAVSAPGFAEVRVPTAGGTPVAVSTSLPEAVTQISQHGGTPLVPDIICTSSAGTPASSSHTVTCSSLATSLGFGPAIKQPHSPVIPSTLTSPTGGSATAATTPTGPTRFPGSPVSTAAAAAAATESISPPATSASAGGRAGRPSSSSLGVSSPLRLQTRQHSISAVYDSTIGSQEEIVERAKQEAHVIQRIAELRKDGLWSERRLPKVQEPQRNKAHWDYLLEEMVWLATDFSQERKWKKAAAKKCARMCQKFHLEQKLREERAEKEAEQKLKRIASAVAKEIKQFWANVEKFVEYKQQSRLDLKRKKVLDLQLSFIVDQTEKYSSWVAQGMSRSVTAGSTQTSLVSSAQLSQSSSPLRSSESGSDEDFEPPSEGSDDEATIALAEEGVDMESQRIEVELLEKESLVPLEDLLKSLPPEILEKPASPMELESTVNDDDEDERGSEADEYEPGEAWNLLSGTRKRKISDQNKEASGSEEFRLGSSAESSDDEATIDEQEALERGVDHAGELADLKNESEMSLEDIISKYRGAYESDLDAVASRSRDTSSSSESDEELDVEDSDEEEPSNEDSDSPSDDGMLDIGIESLIHPVSETEAAAAGEDGSARKGPGKEITDIAAAAESFKPKGYTYLTTQVATKVPFLIKHRLREYQHIGLDWLVTMYERKLNGILADEMGLGKTIQTIALLAHLACEKGNWGPHLIVVPTSVMLNWEMEFKKWCPAFKILTYYGTQKERKQKRQGWTKPNTFHVCITSYKLVIQDHQSFRRKKWKYLILDEAQNIKNFKSQRWQLLLNFQSQRRLLLTGTPLQNNLMELWSLMHFLMPSVFHSHRDFKEWFANPVSDMIEGSHEYDKELINRLHKVLRPFLLRRLKSEVEKQLPRKFEHVVLCRLSKRQRYLYDDFMSQTKTKETLATGNFMSVINILMQLRKVCNHPNLFEARPTVSPFQMEGICYHSASLVHRALEYDPFRQVDLMSMNLMLADLELCLTAFAAHRVKRFQTPRRLIEEIDSAPDPPPKCPAGKIKLHVRTTSSVAAQKPGNSPSAPGAANAPTKQQQGAPASSPAAAGSPGVMSVKPMLPPVPSASPSLTGPRVSSPVSQSSSAPATTTAASTPPATSQQAGGQSLSTYTLQLVPQQPQGSVSVAQLGTSSIVASTPITVQIQQTQQGPRLMVPSGQLTQIPAGFAQLVQTSTGQHILLTSASQTVLQPVNAVQSLGQASMAANRMTARPSTVNPGTAQISTVGSTAAPQTRTQAAPQSTSVAATATATTTTKPILRVAPLNVMATQVTKSATAVSSGSAATTTVMATSTPLLASPTSVPAVAAYETVVQSSPPVTKPACKPIVEVVEGPKLPNKVRPVPASAPRSLFHLESVADIRRRCRRGRLDQLARFNTRRCEACPIYGSDLIKAVTVMDDTSSKGPSWRGMGFVHCLNAVHLQAHPDYYWNQTQKLADLVHTPESLIRLLHDILSRFAFVVPSVMAPQITVHASHPSPSQLLSDRVKSALLRRELSTRAACLHPIASATTTQFPDARLIQYDCGKLQTLDRLLRRLKSEGRRVLIFTQMTRMLDVLEQFLNYHGHIYLRLDGTTRVEQRQALMERFNADLRIFCFILSTRSGGIGVNLTGADTVIFYDSDWNPTMDAQAQDRCHRIGQTRDVHIYRLVSERTVEENILKKANQKRLLGEVAIEGGNFTTAFFKKHTIQELFDVDFDSIKEAPSTALRKELPTVKVDALSHPGVGDAISNVQLEHALANAEEDTDVQAARNAKKEADLELAEFDESIPYDADGARDEESTKVEEELGAMMAELTPVQRYAMHFLESIQEEFSLEQLKQAEEEIEAQKKDWELGRLQALKEEEERRAQLEDNDVPFTYSREDANNQVYVSYNTGEQMPIWAPPTPPQDKGDMYIDYGLCFLYEPNTMPESQLPPVYVKKDHKRARVDGGLNARKHKIRKDDTLCIPRSLFDRPSATILKMRRDVKMQKMGASGKPSSAPGYKPPAVINKPIIDTHQDSPEWLIHEDWALLQAVQTLLELPLNLLVLSPGHTPNWDLVADVVNMTSRIFRSPKQCKNRYESVIIPREEGKILYDTNPKKQKKSKGIYRTKNNRPMRTSQLFLQDDNGAFTTLFHQKFESIKAVANKRAPTLRHAIVNPSGRNPKHAAVLAESGISYEQPLTPVQVAMNRAERINRDKHKTQVLTPEQLSIQQQRQQQLQQVMGAAAAGQVVASPTHSPAAPAVSAQAVIGLTTAGQMTPQQLQSVIGRMAASNATNLVSPAGPTSVTPGAVRAQRASVATGGLVIPEFASGVSQVRSQVCSPTVPQTVVSMANLSPLQVQTMLGAQQRVTAGTIAVTTVGMTGPISSPVAAVAGGKSLTVAQLQLLRTHSIYKQQRLQQAAQQQVQGAVQPSKASVAVTSLLTSSMVPAQGSPIQQRAQTGKPAAMPRPMTEAELSLVKRQQLQLQQQKAVAAAQVAQVQVPAQSQLSSQLYTQAQLHQLQQQSPASGQGTLATLVKTVTTPTSLGTASPNSVTIPVSAVGMAGVNINVNLPQVKASIGSPKNTLIATQQQQFQQLKFQQQFFQQRKLQQQQQQQQQKLAQVQAGAQLGTVQIVQQAQHLKGLPATVTVQQLQQVIKQVPQQKLQHLAQQVSAGGGTATVVTQAPGTQALAHSMLAKTGQTTLGSNAVSAALHAAAVQGQQALHTRVIPVGQSLTGLTSASAISQPTSSALTQTIQVVTTAAAQAHIRGTAPSVAMDAAGRTQALVGQATSVLGSPSAAASFSGQTTIPIGLSTGGIKVTTASAQQQAVGLALQQLARESGGQQQQPQAK